MHQAARSDAGYDGDPRHLARWRAGPAEPPSIAVWEITLRCDLGCGHCGSRAGKARHDELTTAEALDLVHQFAALGLQEIALIGGEFYLREDWDVIAAEVVRVGMMCSIVTGARQMSEARVARAVAAGVGKISLSIDGLEHTHDAIRGSKGSWRAAVAAARRISDAGIDLSVNTQMNRLTMPELPAIADLLVEIEARSWMVILTAAMGRAADRSMLMLQPYHLLYLFPLLSQIKRDRLDPNGIALFPANNVGYSSALAESLRYGADQGYAWHGCGAGLSSLGIEADGSVKGCPSLPSSAYVRGTVRSRSLATIWSEIAAERVQKPTLLWGRCETCAFAKPCGGGCTWTSHVLFGRAGNNPFCHLRAQTLIDEGRIERIEPIGPAPGLPFDHGSHRIIEEEAGSLLEGDPVIEKTLAAQLFGLRDDIASVWSDSELATVMRGRTQPLPERPIPATPDSL